MNEVELSQTTKELIQEVEKKIQAPLELEFKDKAVGYLRHDQAQHYLHGGKLKVEVYDKTAPDYTITHELLHFLLLLEQTPKIAFNLTTGKIERDHKFMLAGVELYDTVLHFKVYERQRELAVITDEIEELYFKGILAVLEPEPRERRDQWMVLRTLTLLDALVFFKDQQASVLPKLQELYPQATVAAQKLYALLTEKKLETAFELRRAVVRLWKAFDEQLHAWQLLPMQLNDFITLTPVLSARQLRLPVNSLFEFYHSPWQENLEFTSAYIGRAKVDQQNTFVLPTPKEDAKTYFQKLYSLSTKELLERLGIEYLVR
ncbi:IpaB/EvcA family protein [Ligilactobacillus faecis]|uniref:IpaB/EvcA family protein n=1 Tax=Ligilactobacillus faecis TaxID=762833 RepID=A0ABV4DSL4_9LACO